MYSMGANEILFLLVILGILVVLPIVFVYKYGQLKGRIRELENQLREAQKRMNNVA